MKTMIISKKFLLLVTLFMHGMFVPVTTSAQHDSQPVSSLKPQAENGDASAQLELGEKYRLGEEVTQDYTLAVYWYKQAAKQGSAEAEYKLGVLYANGQGVSQSYKTAADLYLKAANQGISDAQNNLGILYSKGQGVPKDYTKAILWLKKAADSGLTSAQTNLALVYQQTGDVKEAIKWYKIAAEKGERTAQYYLAYNYYEGIGIKQDRKQALKWYEKSAKQNFYKAQSALGALYLNGSPVTKMDRHKAIIFLIDAACQGAPVAQHNLAMVYYYGDKNLPRSYIKAFAWFSVSLKSGLKQSAEPKDKAAKKLTPSEYIEAQKLAESYIEKYSYKGN